MYALGIDPGSLTGKPSLGVALIERVGNDCHYVGSEAIALPAKEPLFRLCREAGERIQGFLDSFGIRPNAGLIEDCDYTKNAKVAHDLTALCWFLADRFGLRPVGASEWQGNAKGGVWARPENAAILRAIGLTTEPKRTLANFYRQGATMTRRNWIANGRALTPHELDACLLAVRA